MINSRRHKIHTRYQTGIYEMTPVPEIRLKGKWIDKSGFKRGDMVLVKQKKNKMTITADKKQD